MTPNLIVEGITEAAERIADVHPGFLQFARLWDRQTKLELLNAAEFIRKLYMAAGLDL